MPTDKQSTNFRFTVETRAALERAARRYGLSHTAVVEQLIHMLDHGYLTIKPGKPKGQSPAE